MVASAASRTSRSRPAAALIVFIAVALAFTLAFLIAGRVVVGVLASRGARSAGALE